MNEIQVQAKYTIEVYAPNGVLKLATEETNLVPTAALNHILQTAYAGAAGVSTHYVGLFQGAYVPVASATSGDIGTAITEFTDYDQVTRPVATFEVPTTGVLNVLEANAAEYTVNADGSEITGAFLTSGGTKGSSTGTLMSIASFSTLAAADAGDTVKVRYSLTLANS